MKENTLNQKEKKEMNKNEILKELENESTKARSAWKKGVALYAIDLLDNLENRKITKENLLNGAKDFKDYSYSGLSLIYDEDICKRLCNNTEKKLTKNGKKCQIKMKIGLTFKPEHYIKRI